MPGLHQILEYDVLDTLGYGARSTIFAVKDQDRKLYALKRVIRESAKDERFLDQAIHEHGVASRFNHPHLRRSFKVIRQRKLLRTSEIFVLMEMVDGHTFEQYQPANYIDLCELCCQVAQGLDVMHQAGYIHADIKPNNIIVTPARQIKIIDFGQSCLDGTIKERIQGTPDYIAPEQVKRRKITPSTDVFNLGATMYWILTRQHVPTLIPKPVDKIKRKGEQRARRGRDPDCKTPSEINPDIPSALSVLVMDCIRTLPNNRPASMAKVDERLQLAIAQMQRRNQQSA